MSFGHVSAAIAKTAIKKLAEPTTLERLVKAATQHPEIPRLNRSQRARLIQVLRTQPAQDALIDQDEDGTATLSEILAHDVLRSNPSPDSLRLSEALVTEFPGALNMEVVFGVFAYKLRQMDATLHAIRRSVDEGRSTSTTGLAAGSGGLSR